MESEQQKPLLIVIGVVIIIMLAAYAWRLKRFNSADLGFASYTGVTLPPGAIPLMHTTRMSDNFLHETHYWMLSAPAPLLRDLATRAKLVRSDEDARHTLKSMDVFDGAPPEFREGYEGGPDNERDRWLIIIFPGDRAIFAY